MKPTKSSITRKLDKLVGEIVRSKGYCVRCNKQDDTLQCCHIFSRKYRAVRWDLLNLLPLCASDHFWSHSNPVLFVEWVREYLGEQNYIELKNRAKSIRKWTLEEMIEYYNELLKIKQNQWEA